MIYYFEHPCVRATITHVIWRTYHCGQVVDANNFDPVVAVAVTAITIALHEIKTGVYIKSTVHTERFTDIYQDVIHFINLHIRGTPFFDRYVSFFTQVVEYNNRLFPQGNVGEEGD